MAIARFLFLVPFEGIGDLGEQTDQQTLNQPLLADDNFVDLPHHRLDGVEDLVRVYFFKSRHGVTPYANGMLEYWSIGMLGFKCITPLLHHSITPNLY